MRVLLFLLLVAIGPTKPPQDIYFLTPRVGKVLTGMGGTDVAIQVWVEHHAENRWFQLEVWEEGVRIESVGRQMDGEDAERVFPSPRLVHRFGAGAYMLIAKACQAVEDGECQRPRAAVSMKLAVCSSLEDDGC